MESPFTCGFRNKDKLELIKGCTKILPEKHDIAGVISSAGASFFGDRLCNSAYHCHETSGPRCEDKGVRHLGGFFMITHSACDKGSLRLIDLMGLK